MEHPELNILIARSIREDRLKEATARRRAPASSPVNRLRVIAGTALMTIGARIAATPRPVHPQATVGEMPMVASSRNA